jgi:hypothetical protein
MNTVADDLRVLTRAGLALDGRTIAELGADPNGVARAIRLIVILALIVGLVRGLVFAANTVIFSPAEQMEEASKGVEQALEGMLASGGFEDEEDARLIFENVAAGMEMGARIAQLAQDTTPAPHPVPVLFQALGRWLSVPFQWFALWLTWGVLTLIFARLLGGTATIQSMLAATSLGAVPQLLGMLSWVPCIGFVFGLAAWIWSFVVYVKATSVVNRIGGASAFLAVVLPLLIPALLALVSMLFVFFAVAAA